MKNLEKMDSALESVLKTDSKDILIICDKQGKYSLFGRYSIIPKEIGFNAFTAKHTEDYIFSNIIYAVCWCVFHNAGKFNEANRIVTLNNRLSSIKADLQNHVRLFKSAQTSSMKFIYRVKLEEDQLKRDLAVKEMSHYISKGRMIQEHKFYKTKHNKFKYI